MTNKEIRVRFAPSPTGRLHIGNARTALFNWLFARRLGGSLILRVEDTDVERSRAEYESYLKEALGWLGINWDEGPDIGGAFGPYRQSGRASIYAEHTSRLLESGAAYYCFCSTEDLERERARAREAGEMPIYGGRCRDIPTERARARVEAGEPAAVRLKTPRKGELVFTDLVRGELRFDLGLVGDPVLVRPSGIPAYNYAVVVDDHAMRISHVIRGEDHLANTVRQILTYRAFGYDPPRFAHLSMVMGADNTRLSKRHGATSVTQFRNDGILPEALFNYLALLGWAPPEGREVLKRTELIELFRLEKVSRSAAIFDYDKLHWINRRHIQNLAAPELAERALPFIERAGLFPADPAPEHREWLNQAAEVLGDRVDRLTRLADDLARVFDFDPEALGGEEREILESECGRRVLAALAERISTEPEFSYTALAEWSKPIKAETGCRGRDLFHPIRVALTGRASGLDFDKLIPLVEAGAGLNWPRPLKSCRERVAEIQARLDRG